MCGKKCNGLNTTGPEAVIFVAEFSVTVQGDVRYIEKLGNMRYDM